MKAELVLLPGIADSSVQGQEINAFSTEISGPSIILRQNFLVISKRFVGLSGLTMSSSSLVEEMITNFSFGACITAKVPRQSLLITLQL